MLLYQEFARMPEAHVVPAHHPVDDAAARITAKAVPQVRGRGDDAARGVVSLMPRAAASQVLALRDEFQTLRLDEACEAHLALQALQRLVRDTCHAVPPITGVVQKPVKYLGNKITPLQCTSFRSTVNFITKGDPSL